MTLKNLSGVTKNGEKTAELAPNLKVDKEGKKCNCHQRISDIKKVDTMPSRVAKRERNSFLSRVDNATYKHEIICIGGVKSDGAL